MPNVLTGQAHALKTLGDQAGALESYRAAILAKPSFGEVYWSMANLKIFKFEDQEVSAMLQQLERDDLSESENIHFRFALGKAFEDKQDYDQAWHYYDTGNQQQRMTVNYDAQPMEIRRKQLKEVFSPEFLQQRAAYGHDAPDPIFIVGLPRSGSTLLEQILASHSMVEGTAELPDIIAIAREIRAGSD